MVDGGLAQNAGALAQAVAALPNSGPVKTLFNTHWHPEQTGSNETLGTAGATIIAQENTRLWLQQNITWPWNGQKFKKLAKVAQPNKTFYDKGTLGSGASEIRYGYISDAAHTDGDLYVYFPQQNVLAVGDAAYGQGWPVVDWWTGGWIGGIVGGLQRIQSVANKDTKIVPAVGPVLSLADITAQVDMYGTDLRSPESDAEQRARPVGSASRPSRPRNSKPRWATRMNSFAALSRACGRIFHRMLEDLMRAMRTMRHIKNSIPLIAAHRLGWRLYRPVRSSQSRPAPADAQLATMKQYCSGCHSDKLKTGGVSFEGITAATIAQDPERFEKAVRKLRGRVMPPPGAKQPDGKAVDSLVAWLEDSLDKVPTQAYITDQVVLHRLNRKEYENAVRDLLLVEVNGAELLPQDDVAQGFDNIASALQVSPSFIEQYVSAARNVAVEGDGQARCSRAGLDIQGDSPAISSPTFPDCLSGRGAAFSRKWISRPTANTTSTSPTWPPISGAMAWSTRIRWW